MTRIIIIAQSPQTSVGELTDNGNPAHVYFKDRNGPRWTQELDPGTYVFTCDATTATAGETVTVTVQDSDGNQLGSEPGQTAGNIPTVTIDVRFTVLAALAYSATRTMMARLVATKKPTGRKSTRKKVAANAGTSKKAPKKKPAAKKRARKKPVRKKVTGKKAAGKKIVRKRKSGKARGKKAVKRS